MKTAFGSVAVLALGLGFVGAATGCEAEDCEIVKETPDGGTETREGTCLESLKKFNGTPDTREVAWVAGASVTVDGRNGDILVQQGSAGLVTATFKPWVFRGHSTTPEEAAADMSELIIQADGNTSLVTVKLSRQDDGKTTLGADIVVGLPPEFDGELRVIQDNGSTDVTFAGAATHFGLDSDNGSCDFTAGSAARTIQVTCDNGGITGSVPVPADAANSVVTSGNGDIDLTFATGSALFNVSAQADSGTVILHDEAPACTVQAPAESSKTVSCNGATTANPTYTVTATGLGDVDLRF